MASTKVTCQFCQGGFSVTFLGEHISACSKNPKKLDTMCPICRKTFRSLRGLGHHMLISRHFPPTVDHVSPAVVATRDNESQTEAVPAMGALLDICFKSREEAPGNSQYHVKKKKQKQAKTQKQKSVSKQHLLVDTRGSSQGGYGAANPSPPPNMERRPSWSKPRPPPSPGRCDQDRSPTAPKPPPSPHGPDKRLQKGLSFKLKSTEKQNSPGQKRRSIRRTASGSTKRQK